MKKTSVLSVLFGAFLVLPAVAAPKVDPVAEGFPVWQGVIEKNYIMGRHLTPSDLRHRITIVVEIEPVGGLQKQLVNVGDLAVLNGLAGFHAGENWETLEMPRDVLFMIVNRGEKDPDAIRDAICKTPKNADEVTSRALGNLRHPSIPVYDGITFEGAPDSAGKRPFVYVMGPTGKEPLCQGAYGLSTVKDVRAAVAKARKQMAASGTKWKPFFGTVEEPKFYPKFAAEIAKGKPLMALTKALQKDVLAKDPEKATEAQILYDALNQTRDDLLLRIRLEAMACPHRAYYDYSQLVKYWPTEKKQLKDVLVKIQSIPDAKTMADMFCKVMAWDDPKFVCKNAGEAKQITAKLTAMKKTLERLKESKVIVIQNGALLLDGQIDNLISTIPMRVPEK